MKVRTHVQRSLHQAAVSSDVGRKSQGSQQLRPPPARGVFAQINWRWNPFASHQIFHLPITAAQQLRDFGFSHQQPGSCGRQLFNASHCSTPFLNQCSRLATLSGQLQNRRKKTRRKMILPRAFSVPAAFRQRSGGLQKLPFFRPVFRGSERSLFFTFRPQCLQVLWQVWPPYRIQPSRSACFAPVLQHGQCKRVVKQLPTVVVSFVRAVK